MELHPVNDIMIFCLYYLKIKIFLVITKLIIRFALAWLRFFFPSLPFPHLLDFAALGVLVWGVVTASLEGVGGLVLGSQHLCHVLFFLTNYTST